MQRDAVGLSSEPSLSGGKTITDLTTRRLKQLTGYLAKVGLPLMIGGCVFVAVTAEWFIRLVLKN